MTPKLTPNGIRVPGWLVNVVLTAIALISAGVAMGQKLQRDADHNRWVDYRLCRMERALNIDTGQICQAPPPRDP